MSRELIDFCLDGLPPHRRDPFDRLLIAQALSEDLTLLSADAVFSSYTAQLQPSLSPTDALSCWSNA
jgi:PIN domain nuclease of toxin-antitoxin system